MFSLLCQIYDVNLQVYIQFNTQNINILYTAKLL
jgi:hypothetical protein